jgi:hypothetical protein
MRQYRFEVTFRVGRSVKVTASSRVDAIVLARAEKIKAGLDDRWSNVIQLLD